MSSEIIVFQGAHNSYLHHCTYAATLTRHINPDTTDLSFCIACAVLTLQEWKQKSWVSFSFPKMCFWHLEGNGAELCYYYFSQHLTFFWQLQSWFDLLGCAFSFIVLTLSLLLKQLLDKISKYCDIATTSI